MSEASLSESTMVGNLDMSKGPDRGLLNRMVEDPVDGHRAKLPWAGITDEMKGTFVRALNVALRMATEKQDHRGMRGCVDTLAKLVGQNQDVLLDKHTSVTVNTQVINSDARTVIAQMIAEGKGEDLARLADRK